MKDRTFRVKLQVTPAGARWGLVALILALGTRPLVSESLTLSSYFPSPLGVYKQLVATGSGSANTLLARDAGAVGIGLGALSPKNKLDVSGAVAVGAYAGTTAAGANAANGLIVSGNVGIGTANPSSNSGLHVYSNNGTVALGSGSQSLSVDNANMFKFNSAGPALGLYSGGGYAGGLQAGGGAVSVVNQSGGTPFSANASSTTAYFAGSPILSSDGSATSVSLAGNAILYGDTNDTYVELGGSPVLQAQSSCGGGVACTGLGVGGTFPLIVYASPRAQVKVSGYYNADAGSDAGCVTQTENTYCPNNYYATWTAGYKAYGQAFQSQPAIPTGVFYTVVPGGGGVTTGDYLPYGVSPVNVNWNAATFLCCPN